MRQMISAPSRIATYALMVFFVGVLVAAGQNRSTRQPEFEVDTSWPMVPAKWRLGQVASIAIDAQDHAWILHRPNTNPPEEKAMAAPPVLEFDRTGRFLQAWGGPGIGFEWPSREHGIHVDQKGNVWI